MKRTGNQCHETKQSPGCLKDKELREMWGCDGPSRTFRYDLGGVVTRRCPIALLKTEFVQEVMKLYSFFEKGILPSGGGISEETSLYRHCMMFMADLSSEAESWWIEKTKETPKKNKGR